MNVITGEFDNMDIVTQFRALRKNYGDIVKMDGLLNRRPCVFLFSPELCENMYRTDGPWPMRISLESLLCYRKNREHIYRGQYGLAVSQGKPWQELRTKVNAHMMQPQAIEAHISQISEVTYEFVKMMRALRNPETHELPSNFKNELFKWSLECSSTIALNCRLGCLNRNLAPDSEPQVMINSVVKIFNLLHRLENLPSMWKVYNTPDLKRLFHLLDTINETSQKYIEQAKLKFQWKTHNYTQDCSVLQKLLRIDERTAHTMALDMLMGGIDTVGNTAAGLLYHIAISPDVQEHLRREVTTLLPDKDSPITIDILNQSRYAKACIKESMRMLPVTSGVLRTMRQDVSIGGYRIPAGFNTIACHQLISMDPTQFPQPDKYFPGRWLRENSLFKKAHPFAYMPFGFGIRMCIGRRFAEMELQTLLLAVVRNFRIEWHHEPLKFEAQVINTIVSPMQFKLIDV
ncbi:cytochrome P450 CYP12A2-like [Pseudomyrmex gracilis]|uniref:cytochrome P450 CYP12A2-like n=1 Tax=Pseudomyrmex gracilis TaxID=219809 RepID=UPI0009956541|nr:cytochrome P450 CYP12A2-like [Pseudomyrmex gracilis]